MSGLTLPIRDLDQGLFWSLFFGHKEGCIPALEELRKQQIQGPPIVYRIAIPESPKKRAVRFVVCFPLTDLILISSSTSTIRSFNNWSIEYNGSDSPVPLPQQEPGYLSLKSQLQALGFFFLVLSIRENILFVQADARYTVATRSDAFSGEIGFSKKRSFRLKHLCRLRLDILQQMGSCTFRRNHCHHLKMVHLNIELNNLNTWNELWDLEKIVSPHILSHP